MKANAFRLTSLAAIVLSASLAGAFADDSKSSDDKSGDKQSQSASSDDKSSSDKSGSDKQSSDSSSGDNKSGDNQSSDDSNNGKVSAIQSKADPLGLPIVGKVMESGSGTAGAQFNKTTLSQALGFVQKNLPEGQNNTGNEKVFSIDPAKLKLAEKVNLQAFFVSQSAGFSSTLGFNTTGVGVKSGNPELIFPNVSSPEDFNPNAANNYGPRTASQPLLPGDFVNIGTFAKGTPLDFFLIANGANGGNTVFNSGGASANPDGMAHTGGFTAAVFAVPQLNSPYLFIEFKDWWGGGDKDFNDAVIAINVGAKTINSLLAAPEPAMCLTLGGFLALAIWAKRRMDRTVPQA